MAHFNASYTSSFSIFGVLLGSELEEQHSYQKRLEMQKDTKHRRKTTWPRDTD